jgi:hypothetical protein
MRAHNCTGGAEWNAGEQSQRPPLFRPDMTFSRRRCHHLVVAKVHFFVECLKKPCFATAAPGPVLRDRDRGQTRPGFPPKGIRKGDLGVAWGPFHPLPGRGRYDAGAVRHSVGRKVASAQIARKCCNPNTAGWPRFRITICTVMAL